MDTVKVESTTPDNFITVDEVAELFKVSSRTVRSWRRRGTLKTAQNRGKTSGFARSEIRAMLAPHKVEV